MVLLMLWQRGNHSRLVFIQACITEDLRVGSSHNRLISVSSSGVESEIAVFAKLFLTGGSSPDFQTVTLLLYVFLVFSSHVHMDRETEAMHPIG